MPRPGWKDLQAGLENWDAAVRDNFRNFSERPTPLFLMAQGTIGSYPASQYAQCDATYESSPGVFVRIWSNGVNWINLVNGNVVA